MVGRRKRIQRKQIRQRSVIHQLSSLLTNRQALARPRHGRPPGNKNKLKIPPNSTQQPSVNSQTAAGSANPPDASRPSTSRSPHYPRHKEMTLILTCWMMYYSMKLTLRLLVHQTPQTAAVSRTGGRSGGGRGGRSTQGTVVKRTESGVYLGFCSVQSILLHLDVIVL